MDGNDLIKPQIIKVQLLVYEGELEYDEEGNIINKLQQTLEYTKEKE